MNKDKLTKLIHQYGIHDMKIDVRRRAVMPDYYMSPFNGVSPNDLHFDTFDEEIANIKLPLDGLKKIAEIIDEWETLHRNPESARLIHEARFINRLYNGL